MYLCIYVFICLSFLLLLVQVTRDELHPERWFSFFLLYLCIYVYTLFLTLGCAGHTWRATLWEVVFFISSFLPLSSSFFPCCLSLSSSFFLSFISFLPCFFYSCLFIYVFIHLSIYLPFVRLHWLLAVSGSGLGLHQAFLASSHLPSLNFSEDLSFPGLASPERLLSELEGDVFTGLPQRVDLFNKLMFFATLLP